MYGKHRTKHNLMNMASYWHDRLFSPRTLEQLARLERLSGNKTGVHQSILLSLWPSVSDGTCISHHYMVNLPSKLRRIFSQICTPQSQWKSRQMWDWSAQRGCGHSCSPSTSGSVLSYLINRSILFRGELTNICTDVGCTVPVELDR